MRREICTLTFGGFSAKHRCGPQTRILFFFVGLHVTLVWFGLQMSNAVLFFDECDAVFRSRDIGGDRLLNSLLTEIERHQGIVFLATNRPYDLDEAMHRRIHTVIEYRAPDHSMRKQIWTTLLETTKIPVVSDIDLDAIAVKYDLTGGF